MIGKFIVIEGIDGSGKATQTELLKKYLNGKGIKVKTDDYPRYETSAWGKLVGRMLMGEFGNPLEISPYLSALPYMVDEYFGGLEIKEWIKDGYCVISNRYFTSNVHGVAKLKGKKQKEFRNWLWDTGWNHAKIYKPDLVIVLLAPPKVCRELILKKEKRNYTKGKKRDIVESNIKHQQLSAKEYKRMIKEDKTWVEVSCCDKKGKLLSPEEINQKVLKNVVKLLHG